MFVGTLLVDPSATRARMPRGEPISASHQRPFPTTLARKRRLKRIGIQSSLAVMLAGFGGAVLSGSLPGMLAPALVPLTVLMGASPALYLGTLLIKNEGRLHCVWDGSKLHFEEGVPPCWVSSARLPPLPNDTVTVHFADEIRGYGAFAKQDIARGTFIGNYEGEHLDLTEYYSRYPDGMSDYCIAIDDEWAIDGSSRAADRDVFSPCHINHSRHTFNVARRTIPAQGQVELYVIQDIRVGEELLLNYGSNYWKTRENIERP